MGFYFLGSLYLNGNWTGGGDTTNTMSNVLIERCFFDGNDPGGWGRHGITVEGGWNFCKNDTIRNCIFYNSFIGINNSNIKKPEIYIHNNIFSNTYISSNADLSSTYVRNNVFINSPNSSVFSASNMVIENNIFYAANPSGCSGCAFTKNIGFLSSDMPGGGNIGSGNMNNTNPQFVNFPLTGAGFSFSYDFHLQANSPGKNAGTDGTDIGIYGGMMPFNVGANPHFPQMMTLTLPSGSSVPAGGTLNVHFTARKQN